MPVWDAFLTERDKRIFGSAGYGKPAGFASPTVQHLLVRGGELYAGHGRPI